MGLLGVGVRLKRELVCWWCGGEQMVGEGERGEGDVGFLSSGDAGCGNARQPGNQITDHSARCQPWLIFHSTRAAARLGPAERQGVGICNAPQNTGPHLSARVFTISPGTRIIIG